MESMEEFYTHKHLVPPEGTNARIGQFNIFRVEDCVAPGRPPVQYTRRDFYKVSLVRGSHVYHYADRSLRVEGTTLLFFNPRVPYTFVQGTGECTGHFCIFREEFFTEALRGGLNELPVFAPGHNPNFPLTGPQDTQITAIFEKMRKELDSDYRFKYDVIRHQVMEIVHFALKLTPAETRYPPTDANARLTTVFTELLERQFPIESTARRFTLRSARDFAERLSVHVNHLNRAIRTTTGKTTSQHIYERLTSEAKILLKHTDWTVADIAYALGFDEPSHFNNFFKKQTTQPPSSFRE